MQRELGGHFGPFSRDTDRELTPLRAQALPLVIGAKSKALAVGCCDIQDPVGLDGSTSGSQQNSSVAHVLQRLSCKRRASIALWAVFRAAKQQKRFWPAGLSAGPNLADERSSARGRVLDYRKVEAPDHQEGACYSEPAVS
jgi:hypothetical protein